MRILGVGIDIQEIDRLRDLFFELSPERTGRIFTPAEMDYFSKKNDPYISLAGRFSAKEAVIKSLGIEKDRGIVMDLIEIVNDERGRPECFLHGSLRKLFEEMGGDSIWVSISHTESSAAAVAICIGD